MKIYPSILEGTADLIFKKLEKLSPLFPHFQIDIADGIFVDNSTAKISDILQTLKEKNSETIFTSKTFDFHLMVDKYEDDVKILEKISHWLKITEVFIHVQVVHKNHPLKYDTFRTGIVLNPEDTVNKSWYNLQLYEKVQLMTVHPGRQGGRFLPPVLNKIDELREKGFFGEIILDGGINNETLPLVLEREFLPDAICPGSYFNENAKIRLKKLQSLLKVGE